MVAGRCSVGARTFQPIAVSVAEASSQAVSEFERHVCDELSANLPNALPVNPG